MTRKKQARYLSTGRAAELLGLADRTVRGLVQSGEIPTAGLRELPGGGTDALLSPEDVEAAAKRPRSGRGRPRKSDSA